MIMKRMIYILAVAAIALTGCTKVMPWENDNPALEEHDSVYPDGATVDLIFSVPAPVATKGDMAVEPEIDNLYVAVFDGAGALKEYVPATPFGNEGYVSTNGKTGMKRFKARVMLKNAERHLNFIANGPKKEDVDAAGGMESALFQQWKTEYPEGAYWQRIVLPNGITAYTFPDKKPDGTAWTDGDKITYYYLEEEEAGKPVYIPAKVSTPQRKLAVYDIEFTDTGRPFYKDNKNLVVNVGDFVNAMGDKIVDGTGYFQSDEVGGAIELVPIVRNFARIKVVPEQVAEGSEPKGNFVPKQFYLMNIPDCGTIAPYSSAVGGFAAQFTTSSDYDEDGKLVVTEPIIATQTDYSVLLNALNGSRYPAAMPSGAKLIQTPAEVEADPTVIDSWTSYNVTNQLNGSGNSVTESAFLFERGIPTKTQAPTYLLVGGELRGDDSGDMYWFKMELTNENGQYFRVFRGMTYALEISAVEIAECYKTPAAAALGTVVSDVSNSIATQNLLQISDGKGTSMWVSFIDYVGNKTDEEEVVTILYKVFNTETGAALTSTFTPQGGTATARYSLDFSPKDETTHVGTKAIKSVSNDSAHSGTDTPDGKNDWREATVTLNKPVTGEILKSELTISGVTTAGEASGKTLSRKVTFNVMNIQQLKLSAKKLDSEAAGEQTKLTIELREGLGFSMFPLILKIEAEKANLNPDVSQNNFDLPVETGPSYFSGKNSFGYLFTINYSDYYDRTKTNPYTTKFELYFTTSKDCSAGGGSNATWISVTDRAGYFFYKPENSDDLYDTSKNFAITQLSVKPYVSLSAESATVRASATEYQLNISSNTSWKAEVIEGDDVQISRTRAVGDNVTGEGSGPVYLRFNSNTASTPRTIKVKVYSTEDENISSTLTLTQKGNVSNEKSVTINDLSFNSDNSAKQEVGDVTVVFDNSSKPNNSRIQLGRRTGGGFGGYTYYNGVITLTPKNGAIITKVVITYYSNAGNSTGAGYSITSGSYSVSASKGTWRGESSVPLTLTIGHNNNNNFPVASAIEITYE